MNFPEVFVAGEDGAGGGGVQKRESFLGPGAVELPCPLEDFAENGIIDGNAVMSRDAVAYGFQGLAGFFFRQLVQAYPVVERGRSQMLEFVGSGSDERRSLSHGFLEEHGTVAGFEEGELEALQGEDYCRRFRLLQARFQQVLALGVEQSSSKEFSQVDANELELGAAFAEGGRDSVQEVRLADAGLADEDGQPSLPMKKKRENVLDLLEPANSRLRLPRCYRLGKILTAPLDKTLRAQLLSLWEFRCFSLETECAQGALHGALKIRSRVLGGEKNAPPAAPVGAREGPGKSLVGSLVLEVLVDAHHEGKGLPRSFDENVGPRLAEKPLIDGDAAKEDRVLVADVDPNTAVFELLDQRSDELDHRRLP